MNITRDVRSPDGLSWFKSSYSGSDGGNCVEMAEADSAVYVRDTKDRGRATLSIPGGQWSAFVAFATGRNG